MNGHVISGTPIVIDNWKWNHSNDQIHFLSHLHADHIVGLNSNWNKPIHTSVLNKQLLIHYYKMKISPNLIKGYDVDSTHSIDINSKDSICVTLIDANHCPGSIMFLFQGFFGTILYTGDFRYNSSIVKLVPTHIDRLYLDNTCCYPKNNHPSREEAMKIIFSIINDNPGKKIVFGMRKLGKEQLLVQVASQMKTLVEINVEDYKKMQLLGIQQHFTCKYSDEKSLIKVVPFEKIFKMKNVDNIIRIVPTSLIAPGEKTDHLYFVPYSDHSNFEELLEFVRQVKPQQLFPIVTSKSMDVLQRFLQHNHSTHACNTVSKSLDYNFASLYTNFPDENKTNNICKRKSTHAAISSRKLTTISMKNKEIKFFDE